MKLSVLIPAYNEEKTIEEILRRVRDININKEIIVVNDGSTDKTGKILSKLNGRDITVVSHSQNRGKGAAIRTGLKYISGDIVIIQDADLEYEPNEYQKLIEPILNGEAEIVYGSRILGGNKKSYLRYYWGGRFLTLITNILYNAKITDVTTCYKAFKMNILKDLDLKCTGFEFCPEITAKVCKQGYKIFEVPVSYRPRKFEEGKKLHWSDGLYAIYTLLKYRFGD